MYRSSKQINNIIAIVIGVFVLIAVGFNLLFPTFRINNKSIDNFSIRKINEKKYLELRIKGGHSFHKVVIKTIAKQSDQNNKFNLKEIYQDELGLYAMGSMISDKEQLNSVLKIPVNNKISNGELIQKGNFIYFISQGKYRTFANAETFDQLGFDWEKVRHNKGEELSSITKGEIIDKTNSYLPDSFVEIDGKIYLVGTEIRQLINNEDLENYVKENFSVIKVASQKLKTLGNINCNEIGENKKVCKFKDILNRGLPQATVFIHLDGKLPIKWLAKIYTFNKINSSTPRRSLSNIKRNLILRYDQRFGAGERVNK